MEGKRRFRVGGDALCRALAIVAIVGAGAAATAADVANTVDAADAVETAADVHPRRGTPLDEPQPAARRRNKEMSPLVAREPDAAGELRRASALRREMRSEDPGARDRARRSAIEAYRAVRLRFPDDSGACAEAAFRAGELLRAASDPAAALGEFAIARERGAGTPFRVRAMLEIGHVQRRGRSFPAALAAYESVFAEEAALPGQRDDAALWIGRVYSDTQRADDARRTWQRVAEGGDDPLDRIRAWDGIAGLSIATGDLEAAAGVIERCREALAEISAEETRLGERVRNALTGMRSIDDLARNVAERARARGDGEEAAKKKTDDTDLSLRRIDRL